MKINLSEMEKTLEEQRRIDERQRGWQPELILGCFLSLGRDNTEYCEKCNLYRECKLTLEAYKIDEKPFK